MLLDRDYYPSDYLDSIRDTLKASKVKIAFTPGKEIENLFIEEDFLVSLLPKEADPVSLHEFLDQIYHREHEICKSLRYLSKQIDPSLKVLLPAIKPSEITDNKKTEQVDFEEAPLAELLYFIADMM